MFGKHIAVLYIIEELIKRQLQFIICKVLEFEFTKRAKMNELKKAEGAAPSQSQDLDETDQGWVSRLAFDFHCSEELFTAISEISDENSLTLRELVLKRVYARERSFRTREQVLMQKIADLESKLASTGISNKGAQLEDQENVRPASATKWKTELGATEMQPVGSRSLSVLASSKRGNTPH